MFKKTIRKPVESEDEEKARADFNRFAAQWEKALKPITGEKVIVFPEEETIPFKDRPLWLGARKPKLKIPIGPLESIYAMYHWYSFLGRQLLDAEILELTNNVFNGIEIKSELWFDKIKNPKDSCGKVFESLDNENRHRLKLRCDRWFKTYLSEDPAANKRARYLIGFRGRLDNLRLKNLDVYNRKLECWEAFVHFGVLSTSAAIGRMWDATRVLIRHYNLVGFDAAVSVDRMSKRLQNAEDDSAQWLLTTYKKHEQFWMDKGQDIILEYDPEAHGPEPGIHIRNLEVPSDLRTLLDLKQSHITLNPQDAGPLIEIFKQYTNPRRVQTSSQGQRTDSRLELEYLEVPSDHPNKLAPLHLGPEKAPDIAGSSAQASAVGSYQLRDPNALSQWRQEVQRITPGQSFRAGYQQSYQAHSQDDLLSRATTSMGNLSVAASALDSSRYRERYDDDMFTRTPQDRPYSTHDTFVSSPKPAEEEPSEERIVTGKSKSHKQDKKTEKRPEKHPRPEEISPKEARSGKRQTGDEARRKLPKILPKEGKK